MNFIMIISVLTHNNLFAEAENHLNTAINLEIYILIEPGNSSTYHLEFHYCWVLDEFWINFKYLREEKKEAYILSQS